MAEALQRGAAVVVVLHDLARLTLSPTASYTMTRGHLT
jgi:hypothetical protein